MDGRIQYFEIRPPAKTFGRIVQIPFGVAQMRRREIKDMLLWNRLINSLIRFCTLMLVVLNVCFLCYNIIWMLILSNLILNDLKTVEGARVNKCVILCIFFWYKGLRRHQWSPGRCKPEPVNWNRPAKQSNHRISRDRLCR